MEDFRLLYYDIEDIHFKVIAVHSWNMHCMPKSHLVKNNCVTNSVIVAMHVHALVVIQLMVPLDSEYTKLAAVSSLKFGFSCWNELGQHFQQHIVVVVKVVIQAQ